MSRSVRVPVPLLIVLAGLALLVAGVWLWSDYSYWACTKHYTFGQVITETCVSRPRYPHRFFGGVLIVAGLVWLTAWFVVARLRLHEANDLGAPKVER